MARYTISTHVAAPPEHVFALWTDLERMGEWVGGVTGVSDVSGPVDQVGTTYVVHFGPMKSPTEILEVERPRRLRHPVRQLAASRPLECHLRARRRRDAHHPDVRDRRTDLGHLVVGLLARIVRGQLSRRAREVRQARRARGSHGHSRVTSSGLRTRSAAAFGSSTTLAAFRVAGYPALWLSGTAAGLGWSATMVAIGWITLTTTNSVLAVGATLAVRLIPGLVLGIPLGGLVDRHDRRTTLILVNLVATLPLLWAAAVGHERDPGRDPADRAEPRTRGRGHAPWNGHADVLVRPGRRRRRDQCHRARQPGRVPRRRRRVHRRRCGDRTARGRRPVHPVRDHGGRRGGLSRRRWRSGPTRTTGTAPGPKLLAIDDPDHTQSTGRLDRADRRPGGGSRLLEHHRLPDVRA